MSLLLEPLRFLGLLLAMLCLLPPPAAGLAAEALGPRPDYKEVAAEIERVVLHEVEQKGLPALSIALVDGQDIVWAKGYGFADPERKVAATADTVYRAGSVSKLFTAVGVLQLVEKHELDLDAPLKRYLPDFSLLKESGKPITLRQLLSHRSGLVREPPVGNYFDPTEPALAATVESLRRTAQVYEPEQRTKYSNAAVAAAGYVFERLQGEPFVKAIQRAVIVPMGLERTSFEPEGDIAKGLAKGFLWTYDGRVFPAPAFRLGTSPAGNLYSTVTDLARLLRFVFNGGEGPGGPLLKAESLQEMLTLQFAGKGEKQGFGVGFALSELDGHPRFGHGGAVYGFATEIAGLADAKLGVAVTASLDGANSVVRRLADHALRSMLARRAGEAPPKLDLTAPVDQELARRLPGRYADGSETLEISQHGGKLFLSRRDLLTEVRSLGDRLVVDDRLAYGPEIRLEGDALRLDNRVFRRVEAKKPEPPPARWRGLIGEYGWDHNTLYILEKDGVLHALIEWFFLYPLREVSENDFAFPDYGLYHGEELIFRRGAGGRALEVDAANVVFERRPVGPEAGETFRIAPLKPVAELREAALRAKPPVESGDFLPPDLVELSALDPTIRLDIRYAGADNFLGTPLYTHGRAFLQLPAAEALLRAHRALKAKGYGLLIHDAYRPWSVTKMFWDATPKSLRMFVADPQKGSRHNRGAAVDLTLYDLATGAPAEMVGGYDEFTPRSYPLYPGGTALQRWHRSLLRQAMEAEGFAVYEFEWWHFDFKDWQRYPIINLPFEELGSK